MVKANTVYQEIVSDRTHTHMNSTIWTTLSNFVAYLGRTGKAEVEETPKGLYLRYINRDPDVVARQEALQKKERMALDEEQRAQRMLEKQIAQAKERMVDELKPSSDEAAQHHTPVDPEKKVELALHNPRKEHLPKPTSAAPVSGLFETEDDEGSDPEKATQGKRKAGNPLEELKRELENKKRAREEEEQQQQQQHQRKNEWEVSKNTPWIAKGIIVKIMNRDLADGKFYKAKAQVLSVDPKDPFVGVLRVLDTDDELEMDQSELETVIPALGKPVQILVGKHKGEVATLVELHTERFSVDLELKNGKPLTFVPYECISKI